MLFFEQIAIWLDSLWVNSAQLTFAVTFILIVVAYPRRRDTDLAPEAPVWIGLTYPSWLDRLSWRALLTAFVVALPLSILIWTAGVAGLLVWAGRIHSP